MRIKRYFGLETRHLRLHDAPRGSQFGAVTSVPIYIYIETGLFKEQMIRMITVEEGRHIVKGSERLSIGAAASLRSYQK